MVADEFGGMESVEEAVAEKFGELREGVVWQAMEAALVIEEPMGG